MIRYPIVLCDLSTPCDGDHGYICIRYTMDCLCSARHDVIHVENVRICIRTQPGLDQPKDIDTGFSLPRGPEFIHSFPSFCLQCF